MSNNHFRNDSRKTIKMTNAIVSRGKNKLHNEGTSIPQL